MDVPSTWFVRGLRRFVGGQAGFLLLPGSLGAHGPAVCSGVQLGSVGKRLADDETGSTGRAASLVGSGAGEERRWSLLVAGNLALRGRKVWWRFVEVWKKRRSGGEDG